MLTKTEKKRLAREARALAMECVNGKIPKLSWHSYCGCAAHAVAVRAGYTGATAEAVAEEVAGYQPFDLDDRKPVGFPQGFFHLIDEATYYESTGEQRGAVVFPLLALADALEEL